MNRTNSIARRVLKVGDSHLITLPKEFVRKNNLKAGDRVGVTYDSILAGKKSGTVMELFIAGGAA